MTNAIESPLTLAQQGDLVIFALNCIPHPDDIGDGANGCCDQCCAPCGVLSELVRDKLINQAVRASRLNYADYAWWVDNVGVNTQWLREAWKRCVYEMPGHPDGQGGVYPEHDD